MGLYFGNHAVVRVTPCLPRPRFEFILQVHQLLHQTVHLGFAFRRRLPGLVDDNRHGTRASSRNCRHPLATLLQLVPAFHVRTVAMTTYLAIGR